VLCRLSQRLPALIRYVQIAVVSTRTLTLTKQVAPVASGSGVVRSNNHPSTNTNAPPSSPPSSETTPVCGEHYCIAKCTNILTKQVPPVESGSGRANENATPSNRNPPPSTEQTPVITNIHHSLPPPPECSPVCVGCRRRSVC
jgi:hypothetical protein